MKKILLYTIPILCVVLILGLVIVNTKDTKANNRNTTPGKAEENNTEVTSSINEFVPEPDENEVDCAVIREGELYEHLCETAFNNGGLEKSTRVETEDGRCYVCIERGYNDCAWVREFTDEEAIEFIESGLWDKLVLHQNSADFDWDKSTVLKYKLQTFLDSADYTTVSYCKGSGVIVTYVGNILRYGGKVYVSVASYDTSITMPDDRLEYAYGVLDEEECGEWLPVENIELSDLSNLDLAKKAGAFFSNIAEKFNLSDGNTSIRTIGKYMEEYEPGRDYAFGVDCTLETEGELFEYLQKQFSENESVRSSGLAEGLDGLIYSVVSYELSDGVNIPVSWVETFTDDEAESFFEKDTFERAVINRKVESYAGILEAKMKAYWDKGNIYTGETFRVLYGSETIIIQYFRDGNHNNSSFVRVARAEYTEESLQEIISGMS